MADPIIASRAATAADAPYIPTGATTVQMQIAAPGDVGASQQADLYKQAGYNILNNPNPGAQGAGVGGAAPAGTDPATPAVPPPSGNGTNIGIGNNRYDLSFIPEDKRAGELQKLNSSYYQSGNDADIAAQIDKLKAGYTKNSTNTLDSSGADSYVNDLKSRSQQASDLLTQHQTELETQRTQQITAANNLYDQQQRRLGISQGEENASQAASEFKLGRAATPYANDEISRLNDLHGSQMQELAGQRASAITQINTAINQGKYDTAEKLIQQQQDMSDKQFQAMQANRTYNIQQIDSQIKQQQAQQAQVKADQDTQTFTLGKLSQLGAAGVTPDQATLDSFDKTIGVPGFSGQYMAAAQKVKDTANQQAQLDVKKDMVSMQAQLYPTQSFQFNGQTYSGTKVPDVKEVGAYTDQNTGQLIHIYGQYDPTTQSWQPIKSAAGSPTGDGVTSVVVPSPTDSTQNRPTRNNNPTNIKVPAAGLAEAQKRYNDPGATVDPIPATDGGQFIKFSSPEKGFEAAKQLITSGGYANLTVDQAMKRWSNNGYGGEIAPSIANKKIASLDASSLDGLVKTMAKREGYNANGTVSAANANQPASTPQQPTVPSQVGADGKFPNEDQILAGFSENNKATIKGMANYEIDPAIAEKTANMGANFIGAAKRLNPNFSQSEYGTRYDFKKDWSNGKYGDNGVVINTAITHLKELSDNIDKLNNGGIPAFNQAENFVGKIFGKSNVTNFDKIVNAVADEYAKVYTGGAATEGSIQSWKNEMNSAQSPEQLKKGVEIMANLMRGQVDSLNQKYTQQMGEPPKHPFVSPQNLETLNSKEFGGKGTSDPVVQDIQDKARVDALRAKYSY